MNALERGIIILEDNLLEVPESASNWPLIATFVEADLTPFRFFFNKFLVKVDDEDGSDGEK
jgi:hypothetical protein